MQGSKFRKRCKIGLNQPLIYIHTYIHPFPTLALLFLFAPFRLGGQKQNCSLAEVKPVSPSSTCPYIPITFAVPYGIPHRGHSVAYRGGVGFNPPKFRSFGKAKPNSQFRGKYIRNNIIRMRVLLICKLSGTTD
jgi:hypothetical protein